VPGPRNLVGQKLKEVRELTVTPGRSHPGEEPQQQKPQNTATTAASGQHRVRKAVVHGSTPPAQPVGTSAEQRAGTMPKAHAGQRPAQRVL